MDPLLDPSIYHRLKKTVKVHIGNIKEELKLVVKIEKTLVQLPTEREGGEPKHSAETKTLIREVDGGIFKKPDSVTADWDQHPYICKAVDSTFLCDLVEYANHSSSKCRKECHTVQAARRSRKFAKAPKHLPSVRIRKSQKLILKREVFNPDWNPLKGWKIHYRDIYINDLVDSSKSKEVNPPRLSSKMENVMLNGDLKEYIMKEEEIDFNLRAKMIVASAIQNNNKLKAADGLLNSQMLPPVDGGSPATTARPLVKVEKGDDGRTLKTIPDDSLDQTVPQLPVMEHEDQLDASSPSNDKADDEIPQKVFNCSQTSDAHDQSPCLSESGLQGFEYNSHAEGIKVNGHSSPLEAPSTENDDLGTQTRTETPAQVSIGEQVDEEIKALLDDVNFEGHPAVVTENSELVEGAHGHEVINSALSPMFVRTEPENSDNTEDKLSPQHDHSHQDDIENEETCENDQQNSGKTPDCVEEEILPSKHKIDDSLIPNRNEQADEVTEAEHVSLDENVPMDMTTPPMEAFNSESEAVQSEMTSEKSGTADDSAEGDQGCVPVDGDQNRQQLPDGDGDIQARESSMAGVLPTDGQPTKDKSLTMHLIPHPEESHSLSEESQADPKEGVETEETMDKRAKSSEEQSGRKGLKLRQSQSLREAEVTSEPTELMAADVPAGVENVPPLEGSLSTVNERSQSVIVSNPRSLSQDESQSFHEEKTIDLKIVKSEIVEDEVKSEVDDGRKNSPVVPAKMTRDEPTILLEHRELFQALTPPPVPMRGRGSKARKVNAQHLNRTAKGKSPDMSQQSIQITSVQTLAPLTDHEVDPSMPPFVNGRHAALTQQGLVALDRNENGDVFIHQKLMRHNSMMLPSPPQTKVPPMNTIDIMMNISNPPPLVDLSKKTPPRTFIPNTRGSEVGTMNELRPRVHDMGMKYQTERPVELLVRRREEDSMKESIDYDPEEQQHHFLEIKRHLLSSKPSAVPKEFDPKMYNIPHSGHAVPMDPRNEGPHHPPPPHIDAVQNVPKIPSPLGKFSGATMEHVKHWKAQNERTNQAPRPCSTEKIPSNPPPESQLYQRVAPPPPPNAVPVVPMNLTPNQAPSLPPNIPRHDKNVPELEPGEVNTALLENLQAIHKMYFKTMQGGDKVLFPKMPSSKNSVPMPTSAPGAVPMVRRAMPPPLRPPHLLPRFPPESQVPPELLNYHISAIAGNIPTPPRLSPSSQKNSQPPMDPPGFAPVGHRLQFHNMNGNFPRPFLPPQLPSQQFQKHVNRNGEVVMVPVPPDVHRFPPNHLQPPGHPQIIPREMLRAEAPISPQTLPQLLMPARSRFLTDKHPGPKEPVEIQHAIEAASAYAKKRRVAEGTPLDLSTKAAKVRRLSWDDGVPDGDQPIDLSVKTKVREEDKSRNPTEVLTMEGRQIILPGYNSQPVRQLSQHSMDIATSEHMPPRGIPPNYLLPPNQFIAQHAMKGFHNPQGGPVGIRPAISNKPIPVPSTSPQHRMPPSFEPQQLLRMPTPEELEMMKLMVRNPSQFVPPSAMLPSPVKHPPIDVPPQLITHPASARQVASDATVDNCLRKKRGRPRGSTNKRRYAQPPPVPPPLQILESSSPTVSSVPTLSTSSSSDTAECQFCDFKAPSRGDVRQHVKAVHFAKFRRDSNKSCEALTPTSEYTVRMLGLPDQRNVQLASAPNRGELRQESNQSGAISQVGCQKPMCSPENQSDSETSQLVIDTSAEIKTGIKEEIHSPTDADLGMTPPHPRVSQELTHDGYVPTEKPPLKITLRRVSSTGDNMPAVFSPLPQEKSPPERKPKFSCGTCGASYNYINGLREHESRHRVDLPYECGVCHLKYKTMGMLSRHKAQKNHQVP